MALVNITAGPKGVNLAGGGVEIVNPGAAILGVPADGEADDLILCDWFAEVIEVEAKVVKRGKAAPVVADEEEKDA